jgi:hypothetical protein
MEEWIAEFRRLKKLNAEMVRMQKTVRRSK